MTLQDVLGMLNLNEMFKNSSDEYKITAINNTLGTLIKEPVLYDSEANIYTYSIELNNSKVDNALRESLVGLTSEEVKSLYQYSLMDMPYIDMILNPSVVLPLGNYPKFIYEYLTNYSIHYLAIKSLNSINISPSVGCKNNLAEIKTFSLDFYPSTNYRTDIVQLINFLFPIEFLSNYRIRDASIVASTLEVNYIPTYFLSEVIP